MSKSLNSFGTPTVMNRAWCGRRSPPCAAPPSTWTGWSGTTASSVSDCSSKATLLGDADGEDRELHGERGLVGSGIRNYRFSVLGLQDIVQYVSLSLELNIYCTRWSVFAMDAV